MSIKNAILTCEKLTVYSPNYAIKIIKRGQKGTVIDNGSINIFCITHENITYSYKVEKNEFKYIDEKSKNIDIIKNCICGNKKYELYLMLLLLSSRNIIIIDKSVLYSKIIQSICNSDYYKINTLPIPYGEYNFSELIIEWYKNDDIFEEEELLIKLLQIVLFKCEDDKIDINKLFV